LAALLQGGGSGIGSRARPSRRATSTSRGRQAPLPIRRESGGERVQRCERRPEASAEILLTTALVKGPAPVDQQHLYPRHSRRSQWPCSRQAVDDRLQLGTGIKDPVATDRNPGAPYRPRRLRRVGHNLLQALSEALAHRRSNKPLGTKRQGHRGLRRRTFGEIVIETRGAQPCEQPVRGTHPCWVDSRTSVFDQHDHAFPADILPHSGQRAKIEVRLRAPAETAGLTGRARTRMSLWLPSPPLLSAGPAYFDAG
jgi:hypothetical protein